MFGSPPACGPLSCRQGFLFEKPKPDNSKKGFKIVLPGNLFAFLIGTTAVGYGNLIDFELQSGNFGGDLGLKTKLVRFQINPIDNMTPENLVSHLHIGKIQVVEQIGKQGQEFIADLVPKKEHTMGPPKKREP